MVQYYVGVSQYKGDDVMHGRSYSTVKEAREAMHQAARITGRMIHLYDENMKVIARARATTPFNCRNRDYVIEYYQGGKNYTLYRDGSIKKQSIW